MSASLKFHHVINVSILLYCCNQQCQCSAEIMLGPLFFLFYLLCFCCYAVLVNVLLLFLLLRCSSMYFIFFSSSSSPSHTYTILQCNKRVLYLYYCCTTPDTTRQSPFLSSACLCRKPIAPFHFHLRSSCPSILL